MSKTPTASALIRELKEHGNPDLAAFSARFFKTGKGQYGHGDIFLGLKVPLTRRLVKPYKNLPFPEIQKLLDSRYHEVRLAGVIILSTRNDAGSFYLKNAARINNWDLVDVSAPQVVGPLIKTKGMGFLKKLARHPLLWNRRIAMLATFHEIKKGNPVPALQIAEILLDDKEDLMHKAVGWMLREVGKRCSTSVLDQFLDTHARRMPRTALRYALERHPEQKRAYYMKKA
ncbi:DNA alkylation repair protein [Candidatus Uhrbacteria bacterium]|nr:DNA alkylation repair protein [Candidatus Uhrbacteria bacterium]